MRTALVSDLPILPGSVSPPVVSQVKVSAHSVDAPVPPKFHNPKSFQIVQVHLFLYNPKHNDIHCNMSLPVLYRMPVPPVLSVSQNYAHAP